MKQTLITFGQQTAQKILRLVRRDPQRTAEGLQIPEPRSTSLQGLWVEVVTCTAGSCTQAGEGWGFALVRRRDNSRLDYARDMLKSTRRKIRIPFYIMGGPTPNHPDRVFVQQDSTGGDYWVIRTCENGSTSYSSSSSSGSSSHSQSQSSSFSSSGSSSNSSSGSSSSVGSSSSNISYLDPPPSGTSCIGSFHYVQWDGTGWMRVEWDGGEYVPVLAYTTDPGNPGYCLPCVDLGGGLYPNEYAPAWPGSYIGQIAHAACCQ